MARYDPLASFNLSNTNTALRSKTIRDIHVDTSDVYVLTDAHIVTFAVGNTTDVTSHAITSGIGDSRRITGDNTHIYIAYSTTSGTIVNKIEKRPKSDISTVEATWTVALSATNAWSSFTITMRPVVSIVAMHGHNHLLISCATNGSNDNTSRLLEGAAISKTDGSHITSIAPDSATTPAWSVMQNVRGGAHDPNSGFVWYTRYQDASNRFIYGYYITSAGGLAAWGTNGSGATATNPLDTTSLQSGQFGVAGSGSILWLADSNSTRTQLTAYNLLASGTPTARFSALSSYNIDITALANATIRDITVSQGYAWVLTNTHFYRHNLTTKGTALNTAITSGIGESRRITNDGTHLYIAYSTTSGTIVNKVEKRALATPGTVDATWTIALPTNTTIQRTPDGTSLIDQTVSNITATPFLLLASSTDYLYCTICTGQFTQNDVTFTVYMHGVAINKNDGTTNNTIKSYAGNQYTIAAAVEGNSFYSHFSFTTFRRLQHQSIANNGQIARFPLTSSGNDLLAAGTVGLAALNGVGWVASSDSTDTTLTAYQVSFIPPNSPFVDPPSYIGAVTNLQGSGRSYTVTYTAPDAAGTATLSLPADSVTEGNQAAPDATIKVADHKPVIIAPTTLSHDSSALIIIQFPTDVTEFVEGDITLSTGTVSGFGGSGSTYHFTLEAPSSGTSLTIDIAADVVPEGNKAADTVTVALDDCVWSRTGSTIPSHTFTGLTANTQYTVKVRGRNGAVIGAESSATVTTAMTPTIPVTNTPIIHAPSNITHSATAEILIVFDDDVTGFAVGDITASAGALSNLQGSGARYTVDLTAPSTGTTLTISIAAGVVTEGNLASATTTINLDDCTWTRIGSPEATHTFTGLDPETSYTVKVRGINGAVVGAEASAMATTDATDTCDWIWTRSKDASYTFTGLTAGQQYTVKVRGHNAAGIGDEASATATPATTTTTATVTPKATSVVQGGTVVFDIVFANAVTDFTIADLSTSLGTLGSFTGSGTTYSVTLTAPNTGTGTITLRLGASGITKLASDVTGTVTLKAPLTATITPQASSINSGANTTLGIVFSESVSDFAVGDITASSGTLSSFTGSGTTYSVVLTAPSSGSGTINISIPVAGVANLSAVPTASVTYSPTATVTITPVDPTTYTGQPVVVKIVFSKTVTGFVIGDITPTAGTLSGFSGSGTTYSVTFTPQSSAGTGRLNIGANVVNEGNTAATEATITIKANTPTITAPSILQHNARGNISIEFQAPVTDFVVGDVTVSAGTLSSFAGTGASYTAVLTAPASGTSLTISVGANVVPEGNAASATSTITLTSSPTVTLSTPDVTIAPEGTADITITFSQSVTGFTADDITTTAGTLTGFRGTGASYSITLNAPATNVDLDITVAVAMDVVTGGNQADDVVISVIVVPQTVGSLYYKNNLISRIYYKGNQITKLQQKDKQVTFLP